MEEDHARNSTCGCWGCKSRYFEKQINSKAFAHDHLEIPSLQLEWLVGHLMARHTKELAQTVVDAGRIGARFTRMELARGKNSKLLTHLL